MRSSILPESCYRRKDLTMQEIENAYKEQKPIVVWVEKICEKEEFLKVKLNDSIFAILPFDEVTIYPFHFSANPERKLPVQIATLLHKNIRVKVTSIVDNCIKVSRKSNMLSSYEQMQNFNVFCMDITRTYTDRVYGDVGDGINGLITRNEISTTRLRSASEILHVNQKIWVNLIDFNDNKQLNLSYKSTFPPFNPDDYVIGDSITCVLKQPLDEMQSAFFAYVNPQVSGIMDVVSWNPAFNYGAKVECTISGATEKGLKLRFARFYNF